MLPIITISREFGSGGHSIGQKVAAELGIPFYDEEIVDKVAEESGYAKEFIKEQGEYTSGIDHWFSMNVFSANSFGSPQDKIFQLQTKLIKDIAAQGPCVIVGRCADYILENSGLNVMNVFIHADYKYRGARVIERYGDNGEDIMKRLKKKDKGRYQYYKFYTDRQWGFFKLYHLHLDSGFIGEDKCVQMIVDTAKDHDK